MVHRQCYEALDRTLRDLTRVDCLLGGKVVVMGGNFRQVLPVARHGGHAATVAAPHSDAPPSGGGCTA